MTSTSKFTNVVYTMCGWVINYYHFGVCFYAMGKVGSTNNEQCYQNSVLVAYFVSI